MPFPFDMADISIALAEIMDMDMLSDLGVFLGGWSSDFAEGALELMPLLALVLTEDSL